MADVNIKKGDREPSISATLKAANAPINLTGATVKFIMRSRVDGTIVKVNAAAVVVSAVAGTVRYDWGATDTDTPGLYDGEFEITKSGGNKITCPNARHLDVLVFEDLA
jgi:hypothetical protein